MYYIVSAVAKVTASLLVSDRASSTSNYRRSASFHVTHNDSLLFVVDATVRVEPDEYVKRAALTATAVVKRRKDPIETGAVATCCVRRRRTMVMRYCTGYVNERRKKCRLSATVSTCWVTKWKARLF